jgi:hypothetical protein
VVQTGDILCAYNDDQHDILVDCDGHGGGNSTNCSGALVQGIYDLDTVGEPFDMFNSSNEGRMALKAWGTVDAVQGTCSDQVPVSDTTSCTLGGDTCCSGACVSGPSGPGTCN